MSAESWGGRDGNELYIYCHCFFRHCSQLFIPTSVRLCCSKKTPRWGQVSPRSSELKQRDWDKGRLSGCSHRVPVRWLALSHSVCLKCLSLRWSICPYGWRHLSGLVSLFSWRKNASPATLNEGRWDDALWQLRRAQEMAAGCAWCCCWALPPCSAPSKDVHTSFIKTKKTQIGEIYRINVDRFVSLYTMFLFFSLRVSFLKAVFHIGAVYMCIMLYIVCNNNNNCDDT